MVCMWREGSGAHSGWSPAGNNCMYWYILFYILYMYVCCMYVCLRRWKRCSINCRRYKTQPSQRVSCTSMYVYMYVCVLTIFVNLQERMRWTQKWTRLWTRLVYIPMIWYLRIFLCMYVCIARVAYFPLLHITHTYIQTVFFTCIQYIHRCIHSTFCTYIHIYNFHRFVP